MKIELMKMFIHRLFEAHTSTRCMFKILKKLMEIRIKIKFSRIISSYFTSESGYKLLLNVGSFNELLFIRLHEKFLQNQKKRNSHCSAFDCLPATVPNFQLNNLLLN